MKLLLALLAVTALLLSACTKQPSPVELAEFSGYTTVSKELTKKLKALSPSVHPAVTPASIQAVNDYVNSWDYVPESKDVWKTPVQFFASGGDCEDFAIAKYHSLRISHEVEILVLEHKISRVIHAVLLVDRRYVLDNLRTDVYSYTELKRAWFIRYAADSQGIRLIK